MIALIVSLPQLDRNSIVMIVHSSSMFVHVRPQFVHLSNLFKKLDELWTNRPTFDLGVAVDRRRTAANISSDYSFLYRQVYSAQSDRAISDCAVVPEL